MSDFVTAYNANGEPQRIPAHWLEHPVLGKGFTKAPSPRLANPVARKKPSRPRASGRK